MSYLVSGNNPAAIKTAERNIFTATAGQTTFTITQGYQVGDIDVFLNGVRLVDSDDYYATNGSTIVLTSGATVGDSLVVVCYRPYQVTDFYTKSEQDTRYVNATGDTMTGELIAPFLTLDRRSWTVGLKVGTTSKDFALYREWANNTNTVSVGNITDGVENIRFDTNGAVLKPNQPAFNAYISASTPTVSGVQKPFTTRAYTGTGLDATNGRFTAPISGMYYFSWSGHTYNATTSSQWLGFMKNGTVIHQVYPNNGNGWNNFHLSIALSLAKNDYVEFYLNGYTTYGVDVNSYSSLTGFLLG